MPTATSVIPLYTLVAACLIAASASTQQFEAARKDHLQDAVAPLVNEGIPRDVDGNGTVDILLKSGSLLLNDGQLGFAWQPPGTSIPLMPSLPFPQRFHFAEDVNGDGRVDLVVSGLNFIPLQTVFSVLFGNVGGSWSSAQIAGATPGIGTLKAVVDVDGDGLPDLISSVGNSAALLLNDGTGGFVDVSATNLPAGLVGRPVAFADVDGDGDMDFVTAGAGLTMQLLQNDGTGKFAVATASGLPTFATMPSVRFGDADGDGDQDLLIATLRGLPLQLLSNSGQGVFTGSGFTLPIADDGRTFSDFDGDGDADLITVGIGGAAFEMRPWRNNGGGQFLQLPALPLAGNQLLGDPDLVDLDGDGDVDIVLGGTLLFLNEGNANFSALQRSAVPQTQATGGTVVAGDLDGDADVDLVIGGTSLFNDGAGVFAVGSQILPFEAVGRCLFDADGDGDLDLAWTTSDMATSGATDGGIAFNQGGSFSLVSLLPSAQLVGDVVAADFDGDGLIDLCSQAGIVLQNQGGGIFVATTQPALGASGPLTVADFDGDGLQDIAMGDGQGWSQWRNLGGMVFQQSGSILAVSPTAITAGDIDGDGDVDVVTGSLSSGYGGSHGFLQTWTNQNGVFAYGGFYLNGSTPPPVLVLRDLDEDGALDLISDRVFINQGNGTFFDRMSGVHGYGAVAAADLDGDGDPELVYAVDALTTATTVFVNRHRHLAAPRFAVVGQPYRIEMAVQPGYGGGGQHVVPALAMNRIVPVVLSGLGVLHIDPALAVSAGVGVTAANGEFELLVQVPNTPTLAGADLFWQGVTVMSGEARLTGFVRDVVLR